MAFDTVTDKSQQPAAKAEEGGSLYDSIMTGPPAAAAPDTGVKTSDVPPPPGAATTTQDRSVAPPADQVVTTPFKGDGPPPPGMTAVVEPPKDGLVPAANGDMPVVPPDTKVADTTGKDVPPPGAPTDVPKPGVAPADVPPPVVAPAVEGVEDKGNCDFKPDYEYKTEQGRAWKAESDQQRTKHIELNANGRYQVQHGDCLETIAERNLKDSNLPSNRAAIKAEVAEIVAANKNRYPSLDCNNEFLRDGWTLTLPRRQQTAQGDPAFDTQYNTVPQKPPIDDRAPQPPRVEQRPVDRPPAAVEVIPPQRDTRGHNHRRIEGNGNVVIEQADNVNIYGRNDAPRAVASNRPYYPEQDYPQDRPVYIPEQRPIYREPVVYRGDEDFEPRRRPPIIIDARIGNNRHGGHQPGWGQQERWGRNNPPWMNDDCFGTGSNNRWDNRGDNRWDNRGQNCDNSGWQRGGSRVAIDFGQDLRRMGRSMPHFDGRSMPYYGNRGGHRGGNGISLSFRI